MTPQKAKRRTRNNQNNSSGPEPVSQPGSSYQQFAARTNDDLNLSVLRRYAPSVATILSISPYVALYHFSPNAQTWEKADIEGPMFVCALFPSQRGEERYAVVIMNRRSLENFVAMLVNPEEVEYQDGFIILKEELPNEAGELGMKVYGLWVHSADMQSGGGEASVPDLNKPDMKEVNYQIMLECAKRAERSQREAEGVQHEVHNQATIRDQDFVRQAEQELVQAEPMGRQLSLRELFGKQREEDGGFSIHHHHPQSGKLSPLFQREPSAPPVPQHRPPQSQPSPLHHQPPIHAPTAIHTYSTTAAVHTSATQFSIEQQQQTTLPQQQLQPQSQQLLSLFQSTAQQPARLPQQQQEPPAPQQTPSHPQSSTPFFQSNPDTDFFHAPPRHTPLHQQQSQQKPSVPPPQQPLAQNGTNGSFPVFGQGLSVDELFRQARQAG